MGLGFTKFTTVRILVFWHRYFSFGMLFKIQHLGFSLFIEIQWFYRGSEEAGTVC